jgi:hypothetical protein
MTRVSGGRSRNVGLLNASKWAVVGMVSGRKSWLDNGASMTGGSFNC